MHTIGAECFELCWKYNYYTCIMWHNKVNFQFVNPFTSVDTHERDVVGGFSVLLNNSFPCYAILGKSCFINIFL